MPFFSVLPRLPWVDTTWSIFVKSANYEPWSAVIRDRLQTKQCVHLYKRRTRLSPPPHFFPNLYVKNDPAPRTSVTLLLEGWVVESWDTLAMVGAVIVVFRARIALKKSNRWRWNGTKRHIRNFYAYILNCNFEYARLVVVDRVFLYAYLSSSSMLLSLVAAVAAAAAATLPRPPVFPVTGFSNT